MQSPTKELAVRIARYEPELDDAPVSREYRVELAAGMTVLDVLCAVQTGAEPSLAFRYSCRAGACGACGVRANGRPVLACTTRVDALLGDALRLDVAPMSNHPVIRDLAADMDPFLGRLAATEPWLQPEHEPTAAAELVMYPEEVERLRLAQTCFACGLCDSAVAAGEVDMNFQGPAALVRVYRFAADVRDAADRERLLAAIGPGRIWDCHPQLAWSDACPLGIDPADKIARLGTAAVQNRLATAKDSRKVAAAR